jgi:hypothetical protein
MVTEEPQPRSEQHAETVSDADREDDNETPELLLSSRNSFNQQY